jgi:hypothetical protein
MSIAKTPPNVRTLSAVRYAGRVPPGTGNARSGRTRVATITTTPTAATAVRVSAWATPRLWPIHNQLTNCDAATATSTANTQAAHREEGSTHRCSHARPCGDTCPVTDTAAMEEP